MWPKIGGFDISDTAAIFIFAVDNDFALGKILQENKSIIEYHTELVANGCFINMQISARGPISQKLNNIYLILFFFYERFLISIVKLIQIQIHVIQTQTTLNKKSTFISEGLFGLAKLPQQKRFLERC